MDLIAERSRARTAIDTPAVASFQALGTTVTVSTTAPDALTAALVHVRGCAERLDATASRFRSDSELAFVEARAGEEVICSEPFVDLLRLACWAAASTGGWFDPTVRDAVEAAGYDRDIAAIERDGPGPARYPRPAGRWRAIRFDLARRTVTLPPGVRLDFGGIGKGYCVDRALATLPLELGGVLVNAGGDLAARGPAPAGGWRCEVAPAANGPADELLLLQRGALATSGLGRRQWERDGERLHALIDPFTSRPALSPWLTVSVLAGSCVAAEVVAKVGWLRGLEGATWAEAQRLAARFRRPDGRAYLTSRWPRAGAGTGAGAGIEEVAA